MNNRSHQLLAQAKKKAAELSLWQAEQAAEMACRLVPVKTGALRATIRVEVDERTGAAQLIAGNEQVTYAAITEYGGHNRAAQPFITPAVESVKKQTPRRARGMRIFR